MTSTIPYARRRLQSQKGQELVVFPLLIFFVYTPLLLWMFVTGMNMVVSIQVNTLARDLDNMFIHGTDYSTYGAQQLAQTIATGLGLQFPAFGSTSGVTNANQATNEGTSGNGIIWVTQIMYVGSTSSPLCSSLPSGTTCTNANSFVYTKQVIFGNSNLTSQKNTTLGTYTGPACTANSTTACITDGGVITSPLTDTNAKLASAYQTAMTNQWQTTADGQTSLTDGQVVYIVECYFQTPSLSLGSIYQVPGTYARYFF